MSPLLKDPWFTAAINRALAKHRKHLTPRQIRVFRARLALTFEHNPRARAILAAERPELVRALDRREPH